MGLARTVVGILAENQNFHLSQGSQVKCREHLFMGWIDLTSHALLAHVGHEFAPVGLVELFTEYRIPIRGRCHAPTSLDASPQKGRVPITEARSITRISG